MVGYVSNVVVFTSVLGTPTGNPIAPVIKMSSNSTLGAIQELRARKIKIPEEVCVVGFSNEPFTKYMELPITSIDQTPLVMGKIAAQVFLEQVKEKKNISIEKKVVLPPELFIRETSSRNLVQLNNDL